MGNFHKCYKRYKTLWEFGMDKGRRKIYEKCKEKGIGFQKLKIEGKAQKMA